MSSRSMPSTAHARLPTNSFRSSFSCGRRSERRRVERRALCRSAGVAASGSALDQDAPGAGGGALRPCRAAPAARTACARPAACATRRGCCARRAPGRGEKG
jgi:hypothetical protein